MYRGITLIILLLLLSGALFFPITIPYDLVSIGSVTPAEEWKLIQDAGGSLFSQHRNYQSGIVSRLNSWQFERGDLSGMEVGIPKGTNAMVHEGDTIVRMYSAVIQQQILDIENQLTINRSALQVLATGEKPPIVQEAEARLTFAREALVLREKEYAIAKQLMQDNLMSRLEFNRIENALELAKIEIKTAEKTLLIANTGTKKESLDLNDSQRAALVKQLAFLKQRNAGYVIRAPFSGIVSPVIEPEEVLILKRVDECIVHIPVRVEEMPFVGDSSMVSVFDPMTAQTFSGRVIAKMPQTQILDGKSVAFVMVAIKPDSSGQHITLGTSAKCTIHCGDLNQRQYLARILRFSIHKN